MDGPTTCRQLGALEAPPDHELRPMLQELATRAAIPEPSLFVLASDVPNAFATGDDPTRAAVTFTTRALRELPLDEVRAVMAHEVGHVVLGHLASRAEVASRLFAGATIASIAAMELGWAAGAATEDTGDDLFFGLLGMAAASAAQRSASRKLMATSRAQEHEADDIAAVLGGSQAALTRALSRFDHLSLSSMQVPPWLRFLGFHEPEDPDATHPSTMNRAGHIGRWRRSETPAAWWCSGCLAPNATASRFCVRCRCPRRGPDEQPSAGCGCTRTPALDEVWCGACGGPGPPARSLAELIDLRTPTAFGLDKTRHRRPPEPELPTRSHRPIDQGLSRVERTLLRRHFARAANRTASSPAEPLSLSPASVEVGDVHTDCTLVVTALGLELLTDQARESVTWADLDELADAGGRSWDALVDGTPLRITVTEGPMAARTNSLFRLVLHSRNGATGEMVW